VECVGAPLHPAQVFEAERPHPAPEIGTDKSLQRRTAVLEPDDDPFSPGSCLERNETISCAVEVADASEVGCAFELTFEGVRPPMIRAAEIECGAFRFGHHSRRVVAADVEE